MSLNVIAYEQTFSCETALRGKDYIHLLDSDGKLIAAFDGVTDFTAFTIEGGDWTEPTPEGECYLAVWGDDGIIRKGTHKCSDVGSNKSNPTLLINGDFRNPSNSLGQKEYTTAGDCLDGWQTRSNNYKVAVEEDCLRATVLADSTGIQDVIRQAIKGTQYVGKTFTLSAILKDVNAPNIIMRFLYATSGNSAISNTYVAIQEGLNTVTDTVPENTGIIYVTFCCFSSGISAGETFAIERMKVEEGTESTIMYDEPQDPLVEYAKYKAQTEYLPLAGGTMTGNIIQKNLTLHDGSRGVICATAYTEGTINGTELVISGSGNTFLGGGESPTNLRTALQSAVGTNEAYVKTGENLFLSADSAIHLSTNCNTIANRKTLQMTTTGAVVVPVNTDYTTAKARNIKASTTDLTAGTSALSNGEIYLVYV